jgi:hypothetical protein
MRKFLNFALMAHAVITASDRRVEGAGKLEAEKYQGAPRTKLQ